MANKEAIRREAARGKRMFEDYSRALQAERERKGMMFPSLAPGDRGAVSPLDGRSPDKVWSGK
jgi:hypothetical protein